MALHDGNSVTHGNVWSPCDTALAAAMVATAKSRCVAVMASALDGTAAWGVAVLLAAVILGACALTIGVLVSLLRQLKYHSPAL